MNSPEEEDLHHQSVALTLRLATMADRLQQTAKELQELADRMRRRDDLDDVRESGP